MKTKHALSEARQAAETLVGILAPLCERIEVAGSVRRGKAEVGDLELVAEPVPEVNLFGEPTDRTLLDGWLDTSPNIIINKRGSKYCQFTWRGYQVDLFLATLERWGCTLVIRTGSADFSHWIVTPQSRGGALPSEYQWRDSRIWQGGKPINTSEEIDVFSALGLDYIEPARRIKGLWKKEESSHV